MVKHFSFSISQYTILHWHHMNIGTSKISSNSTVRSTATNILTKKHQISTFTGLYEASLWRHNGRDGVWNYQPHDWLLNRSFRPRSKKTLQLRVTGLCAGNSPWPVNSPHKGPATRKMFPFDDVIMGNPKGWGTPCGKCFDGITSSSSIDAQCVWSFYFASIIDAAISHCLKQHWIIISLPLKVILKI